MNLVKVWTDDFQLRPDRALTLRLNAEAAHSAANPIADLFFLPILFPSNDSGEI